MTINWITPTEQEIYDRIVYGDEDVHLMRATLDGEPIAVMVATSLGGEAYDQPDISAEPLAILINEALFNRIVPPADPFEAMKKEEDIGN